MQPIYTKHLGGKETGLLKRNLDKAGYRYVGRSKDIYDNRYTTCGRKSIGQSTDGCEVIFKTTIMRLR